MLKVENAAFSYKKGTDNLFQNLDFEVQKGETLAILGPNGVGKTTLLRCIMRFLMLREGSIFVDNINASTMTSLQFWRKISYVPQAKKLVFGYTALDMVVMGVSQNLAFGTAPKKKDYEKAYHLLDQFGIASLAEQSCNTLSGGQLQMILIARALIKEPELLIMDEPESNLDMKNQLIVLNTIESLTKSNLAIVINTHYPAHALRCAQKTLRLGDDRYAFGDTREMVTEDNIRSFFGIDAEIVNGKNHAKEVKGVLPIDLLEDRHPGYNA